MRLSAGRLKGLGGTALQLEPRPGTIIREVFDWCLANPCKTFSFKQFGNRADAGAWRYTRDYLEEYGLDVRRHSRGLWWCVGREHLDGTYEDFVAQRLAQQQQEQEPAQ